MGAKLLVGDILDIHEFWRRGKCGKGIYANREDGTGTMTHACDLPKDHAGECHMVEGKIVGKRYLYHCPGCQMGHAYNVRTDGNHPSWTFNGNMESPTFTPSLLCTIKYGDEDKERRCHTYLTNGVVQYLGDCTHEYAGKTHPLPDVEEK